MNTNIHIEVEYHEGGTVSRNIEQKNLRNAIPEYHKTIGEMVTNKTIKTFFIMLEQDNKPAKKFMHNNH